MIKLKRNSVTSIDVRYKMIECFLNNPTLSLQQIAMLFNTNRRTLSKYIKIWMDTGGVLSASEILKEKLGGKRPKKNICDMNNGEIWNIMKQQRDTDPTTTLKQYQHIINQRLGRQVAPHISTLCRKFIKEGYSFKKGAKQAKQADRLEQLYFMQLMHQVCTSRDMMIFGDESHICSTDGTKKYGRAKSSNRCDIQSWFSREWDISLLLFVNIYGAVTYDIYMGGVDSIRFIETLYNKLLDKIQPYPSPNSVLIIDNCGIHCNDMVVDAIMDAGGLVLFLPAYSPTYNLAEYWFNYIKNELPKSPTMSFEDAYLQICKSIDDGSKSGKNWSKKLDQIGYK